MTALTSTHAGICSEGGLKQAERQSAWFAIDAHATAQRILNSGQKDNDYTIGISDDDHLA